MFFTIVVFIIVLALLVFVHELGHFLCAKAFGIRVDEFAIGFPPRLYSKKVGETLYSINLLPLGGFVNIYGEDSVNVDEAFKDRSFTNKSKWIQIAVLVSGVLGNLVFGLILLMISNVSIVSGVNETLFFLKLILQALGQFFAHIFNFRSTFSELSGPVAIAQYTGEAARLGFKTLMSFTALISLNLAIVNLIPFPALDGGRIVVVIIEAIKGRQISPKIVYIVNTVGLVLLLLLMVAVTVKDIKGLI